MGFTTFTVVLDPEQPVYIPGQTVKGYVKVDSPENVDCRKITVTFKGRAKVRWSESDGKHTRVYQAKELYFRHQVIVWSGQGIGNTMGPGGKTFPFSYILPRNIPSSFASKFGKVIYQVKAEADFSWGINQKRKVFFSVNFMYDLNLDPFATQKMSLLKTKSVLFTQGPINLNMSAERSGYVPGESIVVNGEVANHSKSTIMYTEIKLVQMIKYIAKHKKKKVYRTVQRVYHPQLAGGGRDVWSAVPLHVPAVPATHLKHCNIITINYTFVLKAKLGLGRNATAEAPIVIGSLPLQATYSTFLPHPVPALSGGDTTTSTTTFSSADYPHSSFSFSHPPSAPYQEPYSSDPPPYSPSFLPEEYSDVPPPSYASCVFAEGEEGRAEENDGVENSDEVFVPRYVTYRTGT